MLLYVYVSCNEGAEKALFEQTQLRVEIDQLKLKLHESSKLIEKKITELKSKYKIFYFEF